MNATAACLTPPGRGAIAVIRVIGSLLDPQLWPFKAANLAITTWPLGRLVYGRWGTTTPEDVVVCQVSAEMIEIHGHGGTAAVARILQDLAALGVPTVTAEVQHSVSLLNELETALIQTSTLRTADLVLAQREVWIAVSQQFAQEEPDAAGQVDMQTKIDRALAFTRFAQHLVETWSVVLTGRPNVGKSSLLNALLGYERAIVTPIAGTTRDVVTGETAIDGWPVRFSDTAGVRITDSDLETEGISRARQQLAAADLVLVVLDRSQAMESIDRELLASYPSALIIAQKSDLKSVWEHPDAIPVSAKTGAGVPELLTAIAARLVPELPPADLPLPITPRLGDWLQTHRGLADGVTSSLR